MAITKRKMKREMGPKPVLEGLEEGIDYKLIPLTKSKWTLVDVGMFDYLNQWNWCLVNGYAGRQSNAKFIYMHREIITEANYVDHINRNKLDNRTINLRSVTNQQNTYNANNLGYSWAEHAKAYESYLHVSGSKVKLGYFKTKEEAYEVYLSTKKEWAGI